MKKIVLVDHSRDFMLSFKQKLDSENCSVSIFSSCVAAIEFISNRDNQRDLVIADLHMPDASGLDLLKSIHEFDTEMPFILITADAKFDFKIAINFGARSIFYKSFSDNSIIQIQTILQELTPQRILNLGSQS